MLRAHISVFAIGTVLLYGTNLFFDPGSSWARWLIVAWVMLLGIHMIAVSLIWALGMWNADDPDEPLFMPVRTRAVSWTVPTDPSAVQDADFRIATADPATSRQTTWNPWRNVEPDPEIAPEDRASWAEASPSAWMTRGEQPVDEKSSRVPPVDD